MNHFYKDALRKKTNFKDHECRLQMILFDFKPTLTSTVNFHIKACNVFFWWSS